MAEIYRGTRLAPTSEMAAAIAAAGHPQRVEPTRWRGEYKSHGGDGSGDYPTKWEQGWHIVTTPEVETVVAQVLVDTASMPKGEARRLARLRLVTERLRLVAAS